MIISEAPQKSSVDIQLINVVGPGDLQNMADFPYGMALITSYLREQGFNSLLLQYPNWNKEEYIDVILDNPATVYGFQVGFDNYLDIRELVARIKIKNPMGKIVFGGPFVVSLYNNLLEQDPSIDAIVLGEGEYTIAELLTKINANDPDWKKINGVAWLNDKGEVVTNDHRVAIRDLDAMPYAARDGIENQFHDTAGNYLYDVRITTSRGCTSNCTFCAVNVNSKLQKTKRWRGRDPKKVVDEIQFLSEKYKVKLINLQDSAFDDPGTWGVRRNRMFCEEIVNRGIEVSMKAYLRANGIKEDPESIELYRLYKESGLDVIIIGVEAASEYELKMYGKSATVEDNFRSFKVLRELDLFFVHVGLIMFGPYTTFDTLRKNIQFEWENGLSFFYHNFDSILLATPGAAIFDSLKSEGRLLGKKNFWEIADYEFTSPLILKLAKHYQHLRTVYSHIDRGSTLVMTASNIHSRLKNKMNKRAITECEKEVEAFRKIFLSNKNKLNDLAYYGFMENINCVEKDGKSADLLSSSKPYFGPEWERSIDEIQVAYDTLVGQLVDRGIPLGGLVYNARFTSRERQTDTLELIEN